MTKKHFLLSLLSLALVVTISGSTALASDGADLFLNAKSAISIPLGQTKTIKFKAVNNGPEAANNFSVAIDFDYGFDVVGATTDYEGNHTLTVSNSFKYLYFHTPEAVPAGETITFTVTLTSMETGSLTNMLATWSSVTDPDTSNNNVTMVVRSR